jgi:3-oxoacyl-[acyl-carrier protein] reductase
VDLVRELEGKVAIVTGSARNIGRATARELAKAGASVVIHARQSRDLCEEAASEIIAEGGKALPYVADIRDAEAVRDMVAAATDAFGGIDILVNNAAMRSNQPFQEIDDESWERVVGTGLTGGFNMSRACVPGMIERGGGCIISLAGMSSYEGAMGRAHVMAAKAGLTALTCGLAIDLGSKGIRANTVVVGVFDTERSGNAPVSAHGDDVSIPLGRKGMPQDMANLIRFLVGPGAAYISGQTIHCNGAALCPH